MRTSLVAVVALALPLGCGTSAPAPTGISVEGLEVAYVRAACRSLFTCPGRPETAAIQSLTGNASTCPQRITPLLTDRVQDLVRSIRAGRIRLDGVAAERCFARIAASCTTDLTLEAACPEAFIGTLAEGAGCWRSQECVPTAWCDHGMSYACPGTCRPRLRPGDACTTSAMCSATAPLKAACIQGRCVSLGVGTPVGENQVCGPVQGASETEWLQVNCLTGFTCFTNRMPSPLCRRPLAEGTPCEAGDTCVFGTVCAESAGTTTRTCRRLSVASREGDRCDAVTNSTVCNPLLGLSCNSATNACARIGDGAAGSACVTGDFSLGCDAMNYCDASMRRCVARLGVGQMCLRDSECVSGECLDGRCMERVCD